MRRLLFSLVCGGWALSAPAADAPKVSLPPLAQRPFVVMDPLKGMGMLLPSGQDTAKTVMLAMMQRYGNGFAVMEDELISIKKLRRMAGNDFKMPPDTQALQDGRLALLEWAVKEAPYRISVGFKSAPKGQKGYVASAECRAKGSKEVIHRVEGTGKGYEDAINDLKTHLGSFCGMLDGVAKTRTQGRLP